MPVYRTDLRKHASRLLAIALAARDKWQIEYADRLTQQASDVFDTAKTLDFARQGHTKKK